jgi:hypothetical protein
MTVTSWRDSGQRAREKQAEREGQKQSRRVNVEGASWEGRKDRRWGNSDDGLVVSAGAVLSLRAEKSMRAGTRKHRPQGQPPRIKPLRTNDVRLS